MTWSLNEIEALSRKAARGAGFTWGQAEEIGKAVRWLEAHRLPGAQTLAAYLQARQTSDSEKMQPDLDTEPARAPGGAICPVLAGLMLSDGLGDGPRIVLEGMRAPLLLLPFLAAAAAARGTAISLSLDGAELCLGADETLRATAMPGSAAVADVTLHFADTQRGTLVQPGLRSACPADAAETLNGFAAHTYAPATEESRLAGAGAGLTDND